METIEGKVDLPFAILPVQSDEVYWYFKIQDGPKEHCIIVEENNSILYNNCFTQLVANVEPDSTRRITAKIGYIGKKIFSQTGPCIEYILAKDVTFSN